ncbi:hypothetical protein LSH36_25g10081 [Paralvinella palmiformis]|uniref:Uncharacterized protein n=1 Tax=Paralvinella palmiformis TaxID=53620 RepID=A0AAD9NEW6_9ANNE|nr:hypothetical protein LSH36_25g10081 [Paralvinella palmiformis]
MAPGGDEDDDVLFDTMLEQDVAHVSCTSERVRSVHVQHNIVISVMYTPSYHGYRDCGRSEKNTIKPTKSNGSSLCTDIYKQCVSIICMLHNQITAVHVLMCVSVHA